MCSLAYPCSVTLALLIAGLAASAHASERLDEPLGLNSVEVVNEDFENPFDGYNLSVFASDNATASIELGDVAGSQGLVYSGTWSIPPGGFEFSSGLAVPEISSPASFQFDPSSVDGIVSVTYSIDAILNGFSGDDIGNLFAVLLIYQQNDEGGVEAFTQTQVQTMVDSETLTNVETQLRREDFLRSDGKLPDFSPDGRPMSFGLQLGALFDAQTFVGDRQGHLRVDNWSVAVEFPDRVFQDRFEGEVSLNQSDL
ncbi:MAG: hypothetical protein V2J42_05630 [Wenzhouxiangella sp.]|jgi:hypothetical protein|nr:hypothetical protein [Wenzhouxiangella sp.]